MSFDALKGLSSTELRAKLKQLSEENFHAKFTTEGATPAGGAEMRTRRREIAQPRTAGGSAQLDPTPRSGGQTRTTVKRPTTRQLTGPPSLLADATRACVSTVSATTKRAVRTPAIHTTRAYPTSRGSAASVVNAMSSTSI